MSEMKYTKEHEWVRVDGDVATCGISDYAQEQLGDIVYVEVPSVGMTVAQAAEIATIESVKAASEIYAPIAGEVVAVNEALADDPSLVNSDPTGEGWFFKLRVAESADLEGLMDEAAYAAYVEEL
jgi:glycine cleavage system H protein